MQCLTLFNVVSVKTFCVPFGFIVCGGYLDDENGFFSSVNYPNSPPTAGYGRGDDTRCYWIINPQSNMSMIWLTFVDVSLGIRNHDGSCR